MNGRRIDGCMLMAAGISGCMTLLLVLILLSIVAEANGCSVYLCAEQWDLSFMPLRGG